MHRHSRTLEPSPASVEEKWRRKLPYRIYDYNYKVGESYYNPQTSYIEERDNLCKKSDPPECASFAERFAARPFYGKYGLPYGEHQAALNQPLAHPRRSSSGSRGSRNEPDDEPLFGRTGRGRDRAPRNRRLSFSFDDDDEDFAPPPQPRRRFSLADSLDFKTPVSKYVDSDYGFRSSVGKENTANDKTVIPNVLSDAIREDIKKLEKQFRKANTLDRGTGGKRSQSWTEVVYNDAMNAPGKRSVKRENVSFTDPKTGSNVRKSSYQESSRFQSSKPPRAPPRPMRLLSMEDAAPEKPRARRRHVSMSDDTDFNLSSRSSLKSDSDDKFSSARKMAVERRAKESEELTNNINMMLDKMRKHSLGELDTFPLRNTDVPRRTRSVRSRFASSYGYSK
ncbi:uncharacterized protein LOC135090556 [Scylla paramamosain]|uniref:uncharacterized protein LOC135090556 n=1 Tax=Scylla paramamosain TaxID=85552 RepID=UPI003082ECDC